MTKEQCKKCPANNPKAEICKHCEFFGVLNSDGTEMDWCFYPCDGGATASLFSCKNFKEKQVKDYNKSDGERGNG